MLYIFLFVCIPGFKEWVDIFDDNDLGTALICLEDEQRDQKSQFLRLILKVEAHGTKSAEVEEPNNKTTEPVVENNVASQPSQPTQPVQPVTQADVSDFDPLHGEQIVQQPVIPEPEIKQESVENSTPIVQQQQVNQVQPEPVEQVQPEQIQPVQQVPQQVIKQEPATVPEIDNNIADAFGDHAFNPMPVQQQQQIQQQQQQPSRPAEPQPQPQEIQQNNNNNQQVPGMTPIAPFTKC